MRIYYVIIALVALVSLGDWCAMAIEDQAVDHSFAMLRSSDVQNRRDAFQSIAKERGRIVDELIRIIESPREGEGDEWLAENSTRNLAIGLLGGWRESNPVVISILSNHLERPEGEPEPFTIDRPFHLCPAANALISIGQPSRKKMVEILATTEDVKRMRANQARLILYYVEGPAEGERLLTEATAAEQDPERQKALQANLEAFKMVRK